MLAFVTSLRHPQNSADYDRVEQLLLETLVSVTQQTSDDFVVIVVGNRMPAFRLPEKVHWVGVDFPPPAPPNGPFTPRDDFVRDKGTKIGIGLLKAREFGPDHVMIFDADDFVHRDLVRWVGEQPADSPGWFVDDGWMYSAARGVVREQPRFFKTCGTCYVIPYDVYGVPADLDVTATQEQLIAGYGDVLPNILGAHRNAIAWHRERGRRLIRFPFRAAVYTVDTGENHSGKALAGLATPLTPVLAAEYGIPLRHSAWRRWLNARGPAARRESREAARAAASKQVSA